MLNLHSERLQLVDQHLYARFSSDMKLALVPVDKVTDNHKILISELYADMIGKSGTIEQKIDEGYLLIRQIGGNYRKTRHKIKKMSLVFQQLIQWGYAVPLFIEPGHPDNVKTAIELGIAIDKTLITFKN